MIKKISKIIFVGIFAVLTFSCSSELEIPSEESLSADANLSTEDVDKLLTGLYNKVREPNTYGYFNVMNTEIMGDNYKPVKFQWSQIQNFYENTVPPGDIILGYCYSDFYEAIDRANTILKVAKATGAQKGAARYNRAISYLRLYDMYERTPLIDETYNGESFVAPSPKEDVLKFIVEDLKFAKLNGTEFSTLDVIGSQKNPTREAAIALLARVYRLQGNNAAAGVEAEELINTGKFSLSPNPLERDSEVVFMFKGVKSEGAGYWGYIMSPEARTWNNFAAADDLTALVKGNDTRKILFDFAGQVANSGYIYSKKYKTENNSDLLVSRIAEMYLISAEAGNTNRLDELQLARKSSLTLEEERRLEMSFEWTRWQELKLKGKVSYVLPYPTKAVESNPLLK